MTKRDVCAAPYFAAGTSPGIVTCFLNKIFQEPCNSGQVEEANSERSSDLPKAV